MRIIDRKSVQIDALGGNLIVGASIVERESDGKQLGLLSVCDVGYKRLKMNEPVTESESNYFDKTGDYLEILFRKKQSVDNFIKQLTALSVEMERYDKEGAD